MAEKKFKGGKRKEAEMDEAKEEQPEAVTTYMTKGWMEVKTLKSEQRRYGYESESEENK